MNKQYKCKGTHKYTYGLGCGEMVDQVKRKFGLGLECGCLGKWKKTDRAWPYIQSSIIPKAKKMVKDMEARSEKERMSKMRLDSTSPDRYRSRYVQPLINKIARLIDHGQPCTPTGNYDGKMAGGHYTSVGANRTICLNLHNIFIQSFHSNSWKGGDDKRYRAALIKIFGPNYLEFIEHLNSHRAIKLTKPQLVDIKTKAQKIILRLEENLQVLRPQQRIALRNEVNMELFIYDIEYCEFKN